MSTTTTSASSVSALVLRAQEVAKRSTPLHPSASVDLLQKLPIDLDWMLFDAVSSREEIQSKVVEIIAAAMRFYIDFEGI